MTMMNLVTSRLEALLNGWRWRAKFILNLSTLDPWHVIVTFIVWDDDVGDDDVIDDYGDDDDDDDDDDDALAGH